MKKWIAFLLIVPFIFSWLAFSVSAEASRRVTVSAELRELLFAQGNKTDRNYMDEDTAILRINTALIFTILSGGKVETLEDFFYYGKTYGSRYVSFEQGEMELTEDKAKNYILDLLELGTRPVIFGKECQAKKIFCYENYGFRNGAFLYYQTDRGNFVRLYWNEDQEGVWLTEEQMMKAMFGYARAAKERQDILHFYEPLFPYADFIHYMSCTDNGMNEDGVEEYLDRAEDKEVQSILRYLQRFVRNNDIFWWMAGGVFVFFLGTGTGFVLRKIKKKRKKNASVTEAPSVEK